MAYTTRNFKTKAELKRALVRVDEVSTPTCDQCGEPVYNGKDVIRVYVAKRAIGPFRQIAWHPDCAPYCVTLSRLTA